jgi:hypothetical protein
MSYLVICFLLDPTDVKLQTEVSKVNSCTHHTGMVAAAQD